MGYIIEEDLVVAHNTELWMHTRTGNKDIKIESLGTGKVVLIPGSGGVYSEGNIELSNQNFHFIGNLTGDASGSSSSCTGNALNATTADKVANALTFSTGLSAGGTFDGANARTVSVAMDDSVHGNRSGGSLHSNVVAAGAAGFMTGTDKTKLDNLSANQLQKTVYAAPSAGPGTPAFRVLDTDHIPELSASKITSGTFNTARIPELSASKITSGTFSTARIPDLSAAKITTGTLPYDRGGTGNSSYQSGELLIFSGSSIQSSGCILSSFVSANPPIAGLSKCKITFDTKGLVTSGADLASSDIPNLDAAKITSGTFATAQIPNLDASKITSGAWTGSFIVTFMGLPATVTVSHGIITGVS
jgi:hypothetical protein